MSDAGFESSRMAGQADGMGNGICRGLGAAPGHATGRAHVVRTAQESLSIPAGSILIIRIVHPHLAPLLARVGGIIVEEGALLQHATTLAREFGVPAIVALRRATELFATGDLLEVNGITGEVIRREPAP